MRDRRGSRGALWVIASILAFLAYPLSFGPACWLADRGVVPFNAVFKGYAPIISAMRVVKPVQSAFIWYAGIGSPNGSFAALMFLISTSIEGSTGDFISRDPIDEPDEAGLPEADEDVILDESPCLTEPASESSIPRSSA